LDHVPDIVGHPVVGIGGASFGWLGGALVVVNHGLEQFLDANDCGAMRPDLRERVLASEDLGWGRDIQRVVDQHAQRVLTS
jgi:hypothetical protein